MHFPSCALHSPHSRHSSSCCQELFRQWYNIFPSQRYFPSSHKGTHDPLSWQRPVPQSCCSIQPREVHSSEYLSSKHFFSPTSQNGSIREGPSPWFLYSGLQKLTLICERPKQFLISYAQLSVKEIEIITFPSSVVERLVARSRRSAVDKLYSLQS